MGGRNGMLWSECLCPQNSCVQILTPQGDGIRKRGVQNVIGHPYNY